MSKSYSNLLDLANGNFPAMEEPERKRFPRVMSVPGALSDLDDGGSSAVVPGRLIVVAHQLPVKATRKTDDDGGQFWDFTWDDDNGGLFLHIKDGLPPEMDVIYIGLLPADIDPAEQDDVSRTLLERFDSVPVFLSSEIFDKYYHGFCKRHLWPLFHYVLPFSDRFDRCLWAAYVAANKVFSEKVIEVISPEDDYVWIHDYHLMVLPTFLRRRFNRLRMGFFLHSPFPSSEIYRSLPVREEILKALLNVDLVGFHTFDYARHFLSCCSRMLGLEYESKRGYIAMEYYGRTIGVKIMPSGIHVGGMEAVLRRPETEAVVRDLERKFAGKTVILGVDDMDMFTGVNLKILAMERMLRSHPGWRGRAVLVQILNPAGGDAAEIEAELAAIRRRINGEFGSPGYEPVVFVETPLTLSQRAAYYSVSEAAVVTAVRDGMNLVPYEYVVCRQACRHDPPKSMLVVSEFTGCSPSLSGAIRVNPWNVDATAEAMNHAVAVSDVEKSLRHEKHYRFVRSHDVAYWARSFFQDLERTCVDHFRKRCWGIGLSFGFRVVALDPKFRKLTGNVLHAAYRRARNRAILLDYDGTVTPNLSVNKAPNDEIISVLNKLCDDRKNTVFIVSGRGKESLGNWFAECEKLGIAAEHGYFMRWGADKEWETCVGSHDNEWMETAEPVLAHFTEATDGSYVERKESAVVWHYGDADPVFGSVQAKELLDHLENVLANHPVAVKSGQHIVEVKPQDVNKGSVASKVFASMAENGRAADFVLCIGDDRSDEDMFVAVGDAIKGGVISNDDSVFACTVGQKPSKAEYYVDDAAEVIKMLEGLVDVEDGETSRASCT